VLAMDANNVVLLLNELESAGHITRRRDPADRRRHLVELTDAGRRALLHAEHAERAIEDEVLRTLTIKERETLRNLLRRAVEDAEPSLAEDRQTHHSQDRLRQVRRDGFGDQAAPAANWCSTSH
jgi:DNA-binding PadR family transcriptional regulator